MRTAGNKGFTILEMSIVMLVLAVLTAGVLVGKDLMHAAELRATIQQVEMFNVAHNTFKLKFNCWAGDCDNATQLGFSGGFSIQLSKDETKDADDLMDVLNPVSNAYAFTLMESELSVDAAIFRGPGGLRSLDGTPVVGGATVVPLNGNNNCMIENNPSAAQMEGSTGLHMLHEARLIWGLDTKTRVYLKLSTANALIGGRNLPAFWVINNLSQGYDSSGYPSVITENGTYLQAIASFQPFAAAPIPVNDAATIDTKIDNGAPLTGTVRATSTAQTNLTLGPTYSAARDVGTGVNKCLTTDASGTGVAYNVNSSNPDAKCSQVIRLSIGGSCRS